MSERPPKQEKLFNPNEIKRVSKELNLLISTRKSLESADARRKKKEEEKRRQERINEILGRKKSMEGED